MKQCSSTFCVMCLKYFLKQILHLPALAPNMAVYGELGHLLNTAGYATPSEFCVLTKTRKTQLGAHIYHDQFIQRWHANIQYLEREHIA